MTKRNSLSKAGLVTFQPTLPVKLLFPLVTSRSAIQRLSFCAPLLAVCHRWRRMHQHPRNTSQLLVPNGCSLYRL